MLWKGVPCGLAQSVKAGVSSSSPPRPSRTISRNISHMLRSMSRRSTARSAGTVKARATSAVSRYSVTSATESPANRKTKQ